MRVFIVCRIHLSKKIHLHAKVHSVYDTHEVADEFVEKKKAEGDFNWVVISKTLRSKIAVPKIKIKKVKLSPLPFAERMSWLFEEKVDEIH